MSYDTLTIGVTTKFAFLPSMNSNGLGLIVTFIPVVGIPTFPLKIVSLWKPWVVT